MGAVTSHGRPRQQAVRFVVLLGLVSLFADMTYEGARSVTGPFLRSLGAGAGVVGVVAGLGELAGYALRLLSGYAADRLRRYWLLTGVGYAVNVLAVPMLALAGSWEAAAVLVCLERAGKAVRTPSRDVMLSFASRQLGRGFGFGLHEVLDQVGAVAGPLLVAWAVAGGGYRRGFAALVIPALAALGVLAAARLVFPLPQRFEEMDGTGGHRRGNPDRAQTHEHQRMAHDPRPTAPAGWAAGRFGWYLLFTSLTVAGFAHYQLISYHMEARGVLSGATIPLAFAAAMGVDALAAVVVGRLYDRVGMQALMALPLVAAAVAVLAFQKATAAVWAGVVLWGAALGMQETVMRAAIADLSPPSMRGRAYGTFNFAFGLAWFAGSAAMGFLYSRSPSWAVAFGVGMQLLALPALAAVLRTS